jgi:hypothetical protein
LCFLDLAFQAFWVAAEQARKDPLCMTVFYFILFLFWGNTASREQQPADKQMTQMGESKKRHSGWSAWVESGQQVVQLHYSRLQKCIGFG